MHRVLFELGPVKLYSYGAMLMVSFVVGLWYARRRAPKFGLIPDDITDSMFWAVLIGILGARLGFIVQAIPYFMANPDKLFTLQFEGLTSFGGVIGGILGFWIWCRRKNKPFLPLLDVAGAAFLLVHPIGRIGCLLNGCCHGRVCTHNGCMVQYPNSLLKYEPAQLYDGALNLAFLSILIFIERRGVLKPGQSFAVAIAFHGLARFIYEFWRAGSVEEVKQGLASSTRIEGLPITEGHVAALVLIVVAAIVYIVQARKSRTA